jgi:hypothetical protein
MKYTKSIIRFEPERNENSEIQRGDGTPGRACSRAMGKEQEEM